MSSTSRAMEALCLERRQRRRLANRDVEGAIGSRNGKAGISNISILKGPSKTYGAVALKPTNNDYSQIPQSNHDNNDNNNIDTESTASTSSWSSLDDIPVPLKLRPFVKRLGDFEELTYDEICGILFIIRMADSMLKVAYATFLTRSFVDELRKKLRLEDLDLEIEIAATRWTYQQGSIMTYHRFAADYDAYAMRELSRIALGVLEDSITVTEGLQRIEICEERTMGTTTVYGVKPFKGFERFYRQFPGRITLFPLLASCGCVVYFGGTIVDFLVCAMTGTVAGLIHYLCSTNSQLSGVEEFLIAIATSILSTYATVLFPAGSCFRAQVLGSLFCFLYGLSFVLSLYEITQNLIITGLTRFCLATLRSFGLGFGVAIGLWISGYSGPKHYDHIAAECKNSDRYGAIDPIWFTYMYPLIAIGALMHLRVSTKHWPICLLTQLLALKSQFLLTVVWKQPMFIGNFVPAYIATITAHVLIVTFHKLNLTKLAVEPTAFLLKKLKRRKDITETMVAEAPITPTPLMTPASNVLRFVDHGWADQGDTRNGYRRNNRFQYQRSDLWFCLMPSLYLLVPGAAIWRIAFFSIVESSTQEATGSAVSHVSHLSFQVMITVLFVVGMGQVMGVRLALFSLYGFTELWRRATCLSRRNNNVV